MDHQAKLAAVAAAVIAYIQSEEELLLAHAGAPALPAAPSPPAAAVPRLWGLSGRQDAMQTRTLMQLRAFHGRAPR